MTILSSPRLPSLLAVLACAAVPGCAVDDPADLGPDQPDTTAAALEVPPGPVSIRRVSSNGTGCPIGTLAANVSDDRGALTLTFSELVAETGPGVPLWAGRKNCVVNLVLAVPAGWQYTLGPANLRAYLDLDQGVRSTFSTTAFFEGAGTTRAFQSIKNGPSAGDLVVSDPTAFAGLGWSPCGVERALSLNTAVRIAKTSFNNPSARGLFTNDSIDGEVTQVLGLQWRRCP